MRARTIERSRCREIGPDFIVFALNHDTSHSAAADDVWEWFLKVSGRTEVRVEGNHDTLSATHYFTPELEFEDAEEWMEKLGV